MIKNLQTKGFILNGTGEDAYLTGRFNGADVNVYIITENGKVARIMVGDKNTVGETAIRIRFNQLCNQFLKNDKYIQTLDDQLIPDTEDISSEITLRDKRYEAIFYQLPDGTTFEDIQRQTIQKLLMKYSKEELQEGIQDRSSAIFAEMLNETFNILTVRPVWFMINKYDMNEYYILMYYDNEYNRPHGEDL